jgi:hypothetical protein
LNPNLLRKPSRDPNFERIFRKGWSVMMCFEVGDNQTKTWKIQNLQNPHLLY